MNDYQFLNVELKDSVVRIQLNNPEKANALNGQMWKEIQQVFQWMDEEKKVRVGILSGAGKHFCSGIDVTLLFEMSQGLGEEPGRRSEALRKKILEFQEAFTWIEKCRKPVIAAIHGACIGGALDLITACDMRYATEEAKFSIREIDMGMVADVGTLQRLPYLTNEGALRELAYTGRNFLGSEAAHLGIVNRCFPDEKSLHEEVEQIAKIIAEKSPLAIRGLKQVMLYNRDHSVTEGLNYVATWNSSALLAKDLADSAMAFMQKTKVEYDD